MQILLPNQYVVFHLMSANLFPHYYYITDAPLNRFTDLLRIIDNAVYNIGRDGLNSL